MYEARKICNFLLARYDAKSYELTNLRLNKILYFIHGWSYGHRPTGLIRNHFEAWKLGPVIKPVYDAFKVYGEKPIAAAATYLDYATGQTKPIPYEDVVLADRQFVQRIFETYCEYSTSRLVALSHEPNGPWDQAFKAWETDKRMTPRIPSEAIRAYFVGERGLKPPH